MCAPGDQGKSSDGQREQAELNSLQFGDWQLFRYGVISFRRPSGPLHSCMGAGAAKVLKIGGNRDTLEG